MTRSTRLLLSAAALLSLWAGTGAASAQGYYGDDGPPPFRRGPGWDRPPPPRGPWDRWHHHRHWRDGGFEGRGG
ncbi:hypothetical protein P7D22_04635, partial [Lichenihabitans sp. Uapishka_5]|nr:hypothetical protein [Lichenihabitans sp. Uapishka_5]